MRWLIILAAFVIHASAAFAESLKVTTWNMQWFPSGSSKLATLAKEAETIASAAKIIREISPDILIIQEIRDLETCKKLAEACLPLKLEVLVCSAFKDGFGGVVGQQQVAILSKSQADGAWAEKWKTVGVVDPPRGFAFAVIPFEGKQIGIYSVHLKSNLVKGNSDRENQLNILKRELAAEQVISHTLAITKDYPKLSGFVVAGDFNTNRDQDLFVSEKTLQSFTDGGFRDWVGSLPFKSRITHPGSGRFPDATFDYIFSKGLKQKGALEILPTKVSDHRPVTCEFELPK